ncbi:hypothetical protein GY45DRAFT_1432033 [Cubamyces sp. BRFM 1775]|nr:hypothetical protein GY45DRAFT_1432033 [Cubamyces sp. BRFM 1775]
MLPTTIGNSTGNTRLVRPISWHAAKSRIIQFTRRHKRPSNDHLQIQPVSGDNFTTEQEGIRKTPQVPSDVWEEIICSLDHPADVAATALVCRSLSEQAGAILYRSVSLSSDATMALFHRTVSSAPRIALIVRRFELFVDAIVDGQSPMLLVEILRTLPHLECLSIRRKSPFSRLLGESHEFLNVFSLRFPELRILSADTSSSSWPHIVPFICEHPRLDELHLGMPYLTDSSIPDMTLPSSLRTLTCSPQLLLKQLTPHPDTLTHLYLYWYTSQEFFQIAKLLGPQLVSLRLSMQRNPSEGDVWSLGELAVALPRLQRLQLDMGSSFRYNFPINLRIGKPTQYQLPSPARELTLVWAPNAGQPHGFDIVSASLAQDYFTKFAFDVLAEWSPYARRIIFRHALSPFTSAILSEDRTQLVCALAADTTEDSWKSV